MYVTLRENYETKEYTVYTVLGYDLKGNKVILGLRLNQTESKNRWMQVFDELKVRGVEDVSMDGVSSLNAAYAAFDSFQNRWPQYSDAVDVWKRNLSHAEQLFD